MEIEEMALDQADRIPDIKAHADCREIFRRFWPSHFREQGNCVCPFHEDSNPSLQVTGGFAFCHGEGLKLDALDLYERGTGCSRSQAIERLARQLEIDRVEASTERQPSSKTELIPGKKKKEARGTEAEHAVQHFHSFATREPSQAALEYLERRQALDLLPELRAQGRIGFTNEGLAFPVLAPNEATDGWEIRGIQFINAKTGQKEFSKGTPAGTSFFFFPKSDATTFVIVEG